MSEATTFDCSECGGDGCEHCDWEGTEEVEDITEKLA